MGSIVFRLLFLNSFSLCLVCVYLVFLRIADAQTVLICAMSCNGNGIHKHVTTLLSRDTYVKHLRQTIFADSTNLIMVRWKTRNGGTWTFVCKLD